MVEFISWENHVPSPFDVLLSFLSLVAWTSLLFSPARSTRVSCPYCICSTPPLSLLLFFSSTSVTTGFLLCFHLRPSLWANWMCCVHSLQEFFHSTSILGPHFFLVCSSSWNFAGSAPQGTDNFLTKSATISRHPWSVSPFQHRLPINERKQAHLSLDVRPDRVCTLCPGFYQWWKEAQRLPRRLWGPHPCVQLWVICSELRVNPAVSRSLD